MGQQSLINDASKLKAIQYSARYAVSPDQIQWGDIKIGNVNVGMKLINDQTLIAYWPAEIFQDGEFELLKYSGEVLMSRNLRRNHLEADASLNLNNLQNIYNPFKLTIPLKVGWMEQINESGGVFFCLKTKVDYYSQTICSSPFRLKKGELVLSNRQKGLTIHSAEMGKLPPHGQIDLNQQTDKPKKWFSQLNEGLSWTIQYNRPNLKIIEVVNIGQGFYRIQAIGPKPLRYFTDHFTSTEKNIFAPNNKSPFLKEHPLYWTITAQAKDFLNLEILVPSGGSYTVKIDLSKVPDLADTPVILKTSAPQWTYSSERKVTLSHSQNLSIVAQSDVTPKKDNPVQVDWKIKSGRKGELSRPSLSFKDSKGIEYSYFLETLRGFPFDLGLQGAFTNIKNEIVQGSEWHGLIWVEDLWGLANYDWFRMHFGLSFRQFHPQNKVSIDVSSLSQNTNQTELKTSAFDLRYRLQPGLWGRDETFGLLLSHNELSFLNYQLNLIGVGAFWARNLPFFFDQWLNKVSFLRRPKWVNADVVAFLTNLNDKSPLKTSYQINLYGKIHWTNQFYGDLGFGLRNYSFNDRENIRAPSISLFFTTVGVGFIF